MDAMSDAIEGAEVLLYGVSLKYKESASEAALLEQPPRLDCSSELRLSRRLPTGGQLCPPAGAGYDPPYDAGGAATLGLAAHLVWLA